MGLATDSTKQKSRLVNSKIYKKNLNLNTEKIKILILKMTRSIKENWNVVERCNICVFGVSEGEERMKMLQKHYLKKECLSIFYI